MKNETNKISRRDAIKYLGMTAAGTIAVFSGLNVVGCAKKEEVKDAMLNVIKKKDRVSDAMISTLGFGCMRLPTIDPDDRRAAINEEEALKMIDYAYNHGVNYYDTAWFYHGGQSEPFVGKALKKYKRESVYIATKLPVRVVHNVDDAGNPIFEDPQNIATGTNAVERAKQIFEQQLKNLQTDYIDFYFLHSLRSDEEYRRIFIENKVLDYILKEKEAGRIKRLGFSFHGPKEELPKISDEYKWDFCMIMDNYIDTDIDGKYLYDALVERNIQAIIMEPVRGGQLAELTPAANKILTNAAPNQSISSWAIRWCASLDNVLVVLSGMTKMEHVVDNCNTLNENFKPMTPSEYKTLDMAINEYKRTQPIGCTYCDYCITEGNCPSGVHISAVFRAFNECVNNDALPNPANSKDPNFEKQRRKFLAIMGKINPKEDASRCTQCNICVPKCPQNIDIPAEMTKINDLINALKNMK